MILGLEEAPGNTYHYLHREGQWKATLTHVWYYCTLEDAAIFNHKAQLKRSVTLISANFLIFYA